MDIKERISELISDISEGMYEREEIIALALLGALSDQNTFLHGPPGTAKSLISRRIASAFGEHSYFEYLMNRFSTPEEVFGPVSIKELKNDKYIRKTNRYLPTAEFAFLDEIWKSSPAILNALLTVINERTFHNGNTSESVPLKALIAASNETPPENQGLEALYDRFIIRLHVPPISKLEHFEKLISSKPSRAEVNVDDSIKVTTAEWEGWREEIHNVKLSRETLTTVHLIREKLASKFDELGVYVSDRRWQKAALLLKASAFFNGRTMTNPSDNLLLSHCLWTEQKHRLDVMSIVHKSIKNTGLTHEKNITTLIQNKERVEKEIQQKLFYQENVFKELIVNNEPHLVFQVPDPEHYNHGKKEPHSRTVLIPSKMYKTNSVLEPTDRYGNVLRPFRCNSTGEGSFEFFSQNSNFETYIATPDVQIKKGSRRDDVSDRQVEHWRSLISDMKDQLESCINDIKRREESLQSELNSIFIMSENVEFIHLAVADQLKHLKLQREDCNKIEALCS